MRTLLTAISLLAAACDDKTVVIAPTDMGHATDPVTGPTDDGRFFPPDMTTQVTLEYVDCDMGSPPFLRIDGGYCVVCFGSFRPCCAGAVKCISGTVCNDAGPINWCQ